MANARSRGNIPLTDVDKHCDREQGPQLHRPWRVAPLRGISSFEELRRNGTTNTGIRAGARRVLFFPGVVAASSTVYGTTSNRSCRRSFLSSSSWWWMKKIRNWMDVRTTSAAVKPAAGFLLVSLSLSLSLVFPSFGRASVLHAASRCYRVTRVKYAGQERKRTKRTKRRTRTRRGRGRRRSAKLVGV